MSMLLSLARSLICSFFSSVSCSVYMLSCQDPFCTSHAVGCTYFLSHIYLPSQLRICSATITLAFSPPFLRVFLVRTHHSLRFFAVMFSLATAPSNYELGHHQCCLCCASISVPRRLLVPPLPRVPCDSISLRA